MMQDRTMEVATEKIYADVVPARSSSRKALVASSIGNLLE